MEGEPSAERPLEFWEKVRKLEIEMFPEFKNEDIYGPEGGKYYYFSPSWHFKRGLVTEADVKDFITDQSKTILSLGSGPAYLEKMLVQLGIKQEKITLSDIDSEVLPEGFKSLNLDINGDWTSLGEEKFDLIIFPESFLVSIDTSLEPRGEKFEDDFLHAVLQSLKHLKEGGKIRINGAGTSNLAPIHIDRIVQRLEQANQSVKISIGRSLIEIKA